MSTTAYHPVEHGLEILDIMQTGHCEASLSCHRTGVSTPHNQPEQPAAQENMIRQKFSE